MKAVYLLIILMVSPLAIGSGYWGPDCSSYDGSTNTIDGRITPELSRCPISLGDTLTVRSGGGDVADAIRIGLAVKAYGTTVRIKDYCSSSCFLIAASAANLEFCRGSHIGLHQASSTQATRTYLEYLSWVLPYSEHYYRPIIDSTPNDMITRLHDASYLIAYNVIDC